jgi:hypothetical protein
MCLNFLKDVVHLQGGQLEKIYYFTALAHHGGADVVRRHTEYIKALESTGVATVRGNFKKKFPRCKICGTKYLSHEEKESDVNIALQLLKSFMNGECDTAVLVTGDTDLVSAVRTTKELFPSKTVGIAFPYKRANNHFRAIADFTFKISVDGYRNNQFPDPVKLPDGTILIKPSLW